MSERKTLTITERGEITSGDRRDGRGQWQNLSFKAKDGDGEFSYSCFKTSLFDAIKEGETIDCEFDTKQEGDWINRKVVQIYQGGQPLGGQKKYGSKSPEEIQAIKAQVAFKGVIELFVAGKLDEFVTSANHLAIGSRRWAETVLVLDNPLTDVKQIPAQTIETLGKTPKVQNVTELKKLMSKHRIPTHEAYEILSISSFMQLTDLDQAWKDIKKAKKIELS